MPIPEAAQSKAWVYGRLLNGIAGSDPTESIDMSVVSAVWCQVEVSATDRSLVQRSLTECGMSECDREASTMRLWATRGSLTMRKLSLYLTIIILFYTL